MFLPGVSDQRGQPVGKGMGNAAMARMGNRADVLELFTDTFNQRPLAQQPLILR